MKITYFGTTTLLFDDGKDQILFDAHLTRPSLVQYLLGRARVNETLVDELLAKHGIHRLRAIFVSHTHHDHVLDAPYIAKKTGASIYGSISALNIARGEQVPEAQLVQFEGGQSYTGGGYRVTVLPSLHSKPTIFNNDLGQTIDTPLQQPAKLRDYKEGGSFDFLVEAQGKRYLIRPSFNYIEGQLDGIKADVLFLGIAGIAKADEEMKKKFFAETADKVQPEVILPVHWDNFFTPLDRPLKAMPRFMEKTECVFYELMKYCESRQISCIVQLPRTSVRF